MSLIPSIPPGNELKALLQDIPQLNRKLEEDPALLNGTRLKEQDLSGLVVKNTTLKNLNWLEINLTGAVFENVTIEHSQWVGVRCEECTLRNVTFQGVTLDQREGHDQGRTSFNKSRLDNVRFIESRLLDVVMIDFESSIIHFERSTIKNREDAKIFAPSGTIMSGELRAYITDSTFENGRIANLAYPSEVIIENSRLENASLGGRLKRLEITRSHFEGAGPGYADYVYIVDSKINMGFPEARFIHLKNNEYPEEHKGLLGIGNTDTIVIDGCKKTVNLNLYESRIANLYVRDCGLKDPFLEDAKIGLIQLCNVPITRDVTQSHDAELNKDAWNNASIREAQFHNVTFTGPFPVKGLRIGHLQSSDSQLPDELTRAAKQQSPLSGSCPPLPDLDALKRDALSDEPPPPISRYLQELSPAESPAIRRYAIHNADGILFFREDWIKHYHARNGLGSRPEPPVLLSATLRLKEPGRRLPQHEIALKPGDWQTGIRHLDEPCRGLPLHAIDPPETIQIAYYMGLYPKSVLTLDLQFEPLPAPARFDVTEPWTLYLHWDEVHPKSYSGEITHEAASALLDRKDLLTWVVWSDPATW